MEADMRDNCNKTRGVVPNQINKAMEFIITITEISSLGNG